MSSRHKASCVKKRKSIVLEKLSDTSINSNENENSTKSKRCKKIRSKKVDSSSKNNNENIDENNDENEPPKHPRHFPIKNIYEFQLFINNIDYINRFKCGLCENICYEPRYQYCKCDQVYCQSCLNCYYDCYHHQCPKCQKVTKELIPSDNYFESLNNLKMICHNYRNQCPWNGIYRDYKNHIEKECPKEIINCPNKDCVVKLLREEMDKHLPKCDYREFFCRDCLEKFPYCDKKVHKNFCRRALVQCPQKCGEFFERENYSEHKRVCKNSDIHCPYKVFGCKDKFQRNQTNERLTKDVSKHLDLTVKMVLDLQKKVNRMEKIIEDMKNKNENKDEKNQIINQIDNNNQNIIGREESIHNKINNLQEDNKNSNDFLQKKRLINDDMKEDMMAPNSANFSIFDYDRKDLEHCQINNIIGKEGDNHMYEIPIIYQNLFNVTDNIIEARCLDEKKHYFIFFNKKYDIPANGIKKYSFTIKLLTKCDFIEMGICDKKTIELNNFEFDNKNNNAIYSVASNHKVWNYNEIKECIKLNYSKPLSKIGTTILFTVVPQEKMMEILFNNEQYYPLTKIKCIYNDCFSPFLLFLKNCKVQTIFNY